MKYREIVDGIFLDRPNRFIAHVDVNGTAETVHVKNTGRCKELLLQFSVSRHSGIFHHLQVGQTVGISISFICAAVTMRCFMLAPSFYLYYNG